MSALPPTDWFLSWVRFHVTATAADPSAAEALVANRGIITGEAWAATDKELRACTARLVARCATPKFPNEHVDAIGLELVALRKHREPLPALSPDDPQCPLCEGIGQVTVIHPGCVWSGRVVRHRTLGTVMTCAVLCDQCPRGRRLIDLDRADDRRWPRQLTLGGYFSRIGGIDGVQLLKDHDRELAFVGRGGLSDAARRRAFAAEFPRAAQAAGLV